MKAIVILLLVGSAFGSAPRTKRGLTDVLRSILRTSSDGFHQIGHFADGLEQEIEPAFENVEEAFADSYESLADTLNKGWTTIRRNGEETGNPNDDVEVFSSGTRVPQTQMPGIHHMLQGAFGGHDGNVFDIMSIFGRPSMKWYEGPNVCVSRKLIVNGEPEEEVEEEQDDEKASSEEVFDNKEAPEHEQNEQLRRRRARQRHFPLLQVGFSSQIHSCRDGPAFHECSTIIRDYEGERREVTTFECCYGFSRKEGDSAEDGCSKLELKPMEETLKDMEVEEFVALLESAQMADMLKDNVTIFVPSNDAIEDFQRQLEELNVIGGFEVDQVSYNVDDGFSRRKRDLGDMETPKLEDIVRGHFVQGFVDTNDIKDGALLQNLGSERSLRMNVYNTYPEKVVMANCARITSRDHYATNGVAHVIDRVVMPATMTLAEILDNDIQLRPLRKYLEKAGDLLQKLADKEAGPFTLVAPTDEAFAKLDSALLNKLEAGTDCSLDILNNHLIPNVICSGVIDTKAKTLNQHNQYVTLDRDEEGDFFIEGIKVIVKDVVGTNGVIHIVDQVMVPESARGMTETLEDRPLLMELFEIAGLNEGLDTLSNVTLFGPAEKAIEAMDAQALDDLKGNQEALKEFLLFHMASPKTCKCEMRDNMKLKTGLGDKTIRINTYSSGPGPFGLLGVQSRDIITAQCARVTATDTNVCSGTIHSVEKPLKPAAKSLRTLFTTMEQFSKYKELIDFADLRGTPNDYDEEIAARGEEVLHTYFLPTNAAFEKLEPELLEELFSDKELAREAINRHIIHGYLCCAGISRKNPFFDTTEHMSAGSHPLSIRRSNSGRIYVNKAQVTECDMVAENGVLHAIDRVLLPEALEEERLERNGGGLQTIPINKVLDLLLGGQGGARF